MAKTKNSSETALFVKRRPFGALVDPPPPGMCEYVISLRSEEETEGLKLRSDVSSSNLALTRSFIDGLEKSLRERGLLSDVYSLSPAMRLPFIGIVATSQVIDHIRKMEGVDSVLSD